MQLLTWDKKVIYETDDTEHLPDYRSLLLEAISKGINLEGLRVESQNLDNLTWEKLNLNSITFRNCSMKKNKFIECKGKSLDFDKCRLKGSGFVKSAISEAHISDTDFSSCVIRESEIISGFLIANNFTNASFYDCVLNGTCFHTCKLNNALFKHCGLNQTAFIHSDHAHEWIKDAVFDHCSMFECSMKYVDDISQLYFNETKMMNIEFEPEERFTEISNKYSSVIYAIDRDVIWWKPYSWNQDEKKIFRGTLKEFTEEVRAEFPNTDLYPSMADFRIEDELLLVCKYLESWKDV